MAAELHGFRQVEQFIELLRGRPQRLGRSDLTQRLKICCGIAFDQERAGALDSREKI
jgi:hypothetical protein